MSLQENVGLLEIVQISRLDAQGARLQCAGVWSWMKSGFSLILLCDLGLMLIGGLAALLSVHKLPLSGLLLGCLRLTNKSRESNSAELRGTWDYCMMSGWESFVQ